MTVLDPDVRTAESDNEFAGSVDDLARAIDAYEELGFDDIIFGLDPTTERSLDRVVEAMQVRGK
jgi:alkanesulfonate monooxygenase SsuD/methylene tetrahydromethanopterin reductase-like flavin-dependent oxidoreductase (luciferase family)